eukprot:3304735-Alexandrium_andersonii.AAC.1
MVDAPRAHDQASGQPGQRRPISGGRVRHSPALLSREPQVRAIKAKVVGSCCQRPKAPACGTLKRLGCLFSLCVAPIARKGDPADVRTRRLQQVS